MSRLRLGTRGSPLALYQAHAVADAVAATTGDTCEILVIRTSGDRLAEASLSDAGGKRLFVKEIEDALLSNVIDLAVHSSKDMPVVLPDGLGIAAVLEREDPRDALVLPLGTDAADFEAVLARLGPSPRVGTSSVRRIAQLARLLPGATFLPIRGNLGTRLAKLDAGQFDAIVLAAAGLARLEHRPRISALIPVQACVPAPGQGIIAVETRDDDRRCREIVSQIDWPAAHAALLAERAVVRALGGGCQMPIGAFAEIRNPALALTAIVVSLDGTRQVRSEVHGTVNDAQTIGERAAVSLLAEGAGDILADAERATSAPGGLEA